jgi:hypothetical protein
VEAAAARTQGDVGAVTEGGVSTGLVFPPALLAWLDANEDWQFVAGGPLAVFNVISAEYSAGVPPSANNLSSADRDGAAGGMGRLSGVDEMPLSFLDGD